MNRERLLASRREKEQEAKFGDFSGRLVKRPQKNFLWGYGTQVYDDNKTDEENCFKDGQIPTIKQLINFLEIYQMKDIKVVNLKALNRNMHNFAIVCSAFSTRHSYSTAKTLV